MSGQSPPQQAPGASVHLSCRAPPAGVAEGNILIGTHDDDASVQANAEYNRLILNQVAAEM